MATIGDVAREANVSRSTVSSLLTGRKFVSPDTRSRIEAAIAKLQFSVNAGARALATSRTMTIGVVVRLHEAEFSPAMATYLIALSDAARGHGCSIMLLTEADGAEAVRRVIASRQVDGLVLLNVVNDDPRLEPIAASHFPATLIGMPTEPRGANVVDLDFSASAEKLIDHLAERGHERVMFLKWPAELYETGSTYALRFADSARSRAALHGIHLTEQSIPVDPTKARLKLSDLVGDPSQPEALLVHNDTAAAMLPFILRDLELHVPHDRSIVSLHSSELAQMFALDLTSTPSSPVAVAEAAINLLAQRIAKPDSPSETLLVEPTLVDHQSVADLRP